MKKFLSMLVALSLIAPAVLVGCGEEKKTDKKGPTTAPKGGEKKPEEKKPEEKKADATKPEEKKPEEKKADMPKVEEKKAEPAKGGEKKAEEKAK
jgi:hypothetical protein